jgi:hypothetical protein
MKHIKVIVDKIKDEIEDVEEYVKLALHNKEMDMDAYTVYITLAGDEYDHAMRLHDLVTKEIAKTRKALMEKGEAVPQYMLDMWNEKHEEYIERMGKAKYELEIAKKITPKIM